MAALFRGRVAEIDVHPRVGGAVIHDVGIGEICTEAVAATVEGVRAGAALPSFPLPPSSESLSSPPQRVSFPRPPSTPGCPERRCPSRSSPPVPPMTFSMVDVSAPATVLDLAISSVPEPLLSKGAGGEISASSVPRRLSADVPILSAIASSSQCRRGITPTPTSLPAPPSMAFSLVVRENTSWPEPAERPDPIIAHTSEEEIGAALALDRVVALTAPEGCHHNVTLVVARGSGRGHRGCRLLSHPGRVRGERGIVRVLDRGEGRVVVPVAGGCR